jgi:ATP-dependent DNA ligase
MECLATAKLPAGPGWVWEIKLDGYRALAVKSGGKVMLFSRNHKSLNKKFPIIVEGLADLPNETVIDGEIVGLDVSGRPDFNLLQNFREAASQIVYYVFDLLFCKTRYITHFALKERRELMFSALRLRSKRVFASEFSRSRAKSCSNPRENEVSKGLSANEKTAHDSRQE